MTEEEFYEKYGQKVMTYNRFDANNIYKALHDMDYFLLRYGIEDVGKYTRDDSVVSKYYGVLSVYSN